MELATGIDFGWEVYYYRFRHLASGMGPLNDVDDTDHQHAYSRIMYVVQT